LTAGNAMDHLKDLAAIAYTVLGPIVVLVGTGYFVGRRLSAAADVLTKMFLYVLLPAFLFQRVVASDLGGRSYGIIVAFSAIMVALLYAVARTASGVRGHDRALRGAFINSAILYNSANFAIPVVSLAFGANAQVQADAVAVQSIVAICQGLAAYILGAFIAAAGSGPVGRAVGRVFGLPYLYALALALALKACGVNEAALARVTIVWGPLSALGAAYVPFALMALGAQLSTVRVVRLPLDIALVVAIRLLAGPLLGLGVVRLMGVTGTLGQILVIGVAGPTAVASAVVAFEFKNRPDFASSAVLVSTLAAGLTVPVVIFLVQNFL